MYVRRNSASIEPGRDELAVTLCMTGNTSSVLLHLKIPAYFLKSVEWTGSRPSYE